MKFIDILVVLLVSCANIIIVQCGRNEIGREKQVEITRYQQLNPISATFHFGYELGPDGHFHYERRGPDNVTCGCYGYGDRSGKFYMTHYLADACGYRELPRNTRSAVICITSKGSGSTVRRKFISKLTRTWSELFFPPACGKHAGFLHSGDGAPGVTQTSIQSAQKPTGSGIDDDIGGTKPSAGIVTQPTKLPLGGNRPTKRPTKPASSGVAGGASVASTFGIATLPLYLGPEDELDLRPIMSKPKPVNTNKPNKPVIATGTQTSKPIYIGGASLASSFGIATLPLYLGPEHDISTPIAGEVQVEPTIGLSSETFTGTSLGTGNRPNKPWNNYGIYEGPFGVGHPGTAGHGAVNFSVFNTGLPGAPALNSDFSR